MERIIVFFAKKTMLVNIIVMAILFVGGYYYFNLRKESIPSTDLDMMLISVIGYDVNICNISRCYSA